MEADTSQPHSSSPSKKERDATVEAVNHLIQGKRHLLVQDFSSAVNSLEEACSLLAACYGDLANECGDAYYHYGRALLELSRKESGIFGNSKDESGGEEEEDDEDDEEEDDNENEAESKEEDEEESEEESKSSEGGAASGQTANISVAGGTMQEPGESDGACIAEEISELVNSQCSSKQKEKVDKEDSEAKSEDLDESKKADEETVSAEADVKEKSEVTEEAHDNKPESSGEPSKPSVAAEPSGSAEKPSSNVDDAQPGPSGEQKPKEDGEEITNLQLAWEVLELAKIIFKRQAADNRELQLRLAQVHSKLGEVAMESENYTQSIEDLEECLSLQLPLLEKDDRQLAETYYQLGLAYTFGHDYDSAINGFQLAINTINSRIANLSKIVLINAPPNEQGEDPVFHAKLELEELQELLPELREKIADTMDLKKNTVKVAEELNKDFAPVNEEQKVDSTVSTEKENKPITNIGHLVRKKRKPEDSSSTSANGDESGNKRSKADDASLEKNNSVHVTCSNAESHINGKSVKEELTVAQADTSSVTCLEG